MLPALLLALLFADPAARAAGADGSRRRPFPTLSRALAAARDGEEIRLGAGIFQEAVTVRRPVAISGQATALTVLQPPPGAASAITVLGAEGVVVRDLTVLGGLIGIQLLGGRGHALANLYFSGQVDSGVAGVNAEVEVFACSFADIGGSERSARDSTGVRAIGGAMAVWGSTLVRAGRRSISFENAIGSATDNQIREAALSGISVNDHSRVTAAHNRISDCGGAGVYVANSVLDAWHNHVARSEFGIMAGREGDLTAVANNTWNHRRAGIAFVGSRGLAEENSVFAGGSQAGIALSNPTGVVLRANFIQAPGPVGIHLVGGAAEIGGNQIAGAVHDRDGDFGDGIYLDRAEATVVENTVLANAGAGVVLHASVAWVTRNSVTQNGGDGALVRLGGDVRLIGNDFSDNGGNGVAVRERGSAALEQNRMNRNTLRGLESRCDEEVRVRVGAGNRMGGNVRGPGGGCG